MSESHGSVPCSALMLTHILTSKHWIRHVKFWFLKRNQKLGFTVGKSASLWFSECFTSIWPDIYVIVWLWYFDICLDYLEIKHFAAFQPYFGRKLVLGMAGAFSLTPCLICLAGKTLICNQQFGLSVWKRYTHRTGRASQHLPLKKFRGGTRCQVQ